MHGMHACAHIICLATETCERACMHGMHACAHIICLATETCERPKTNGPRRIISMARHQTFTKKRDCECEWGERVVNGKWL